MKRLIYVANIRIPTEKAHGVQIIKMCEAFAGRGLDVELIVPDRRTHIKENLFAYYGTKNNFRITRLWCLDTVKFGQFGFWVETLTFTGAAVWHILFKKGIFYTRDEFAAFWLRLLGKKVIWEVHMGQKNFFVHTLINFKIPFVVISQGLKNLYLKLGVSIDKITIARDGVDLVQFNVNMGKGEARDKLDLDKNAKLVIYTGSLYFWKGVGTLEKTRHLLSPSVKLLIISGKPYTEIPLYLKAADVLVLPNTAREEISRIFTSPMKLFEYMASGRPIIASDTPSIREILSEKNAVLVESDNPESLAQGIEKLLKDSNLANKISRQAFLDARSYTWQNRAKLILDFIK